MIPDGNSSEENSTVAINDKRMTDNSDDYGLEVRTPVVGYSKKSGISFKDIEL